MVAGKMFTIPLYRLVCDIFFIIGKNLLLFNEVLKANIHYHVGSAVAVKRIFSDDRDTISLRREFGF